MTSVKEITRGGFHIKIDLDLANRVTIYAHRIDTDEVRPMPSYRRWQIGPDHGRYLGPYGEHRRRWWMVRSVPAEQVSFRIDQLIRKINAHRDPDKDDTERILSEIN